ncbi:MAG: ATP synthase subunit I [Burkholderiaceae bacterium]|jgi:ATP synthase protein I
MSRWIAWQWASGLIVSALFALLSLQHASSALFGLLAIAIPNTLFAIRLSLGNRRSMAGAITFLTGEFLKVAATIAIFAVVGVFYRSLIWWAMLAGAVVTLKSYVLAFFLK